MKRLYDHLTQELQLNVWMDDKKLGIESLAAQLADGITRSRVFVCCITSQYSNSIRCKKEFSLAENEKKPMIILMLHRLDQNISGEIRDQIRAKRRFNCYQDMSSVDSFIKSDYLAKAIKFLLDIPSILQADPTYVYRGTLKLADGSYVGDIKNGVRHGQGTIQWVDGTVYEGAYKDDKQHGQGTMKWVDGRVYEGAHKDDKKHGQGTMKWVDGAVYEGSWMDNKENGHGTMKGSGAVYDGAWVNGKKHGQGTFRLASGHAYEGEWKDNKYHGQGTLILSGGQELQAGNWKDGVFQG